MKEKISVPKMGESVSSGIIAAWLKTDGETVYEGDELFELETDKASLAVPATVSGVLATLVAEGEEVSVGQVVAEIDTAAAAPAAEQGAVASQPVAAALDGLSPAVRRIVIEHGLDPASITGTGKNGRITKADALDALSKVLDNKAGLTETQRGAGGQPQSPQSAASQPQETQRTAGSGRPQASTAGAPPAAAGTQPDGETPAWQRREKMTSLRRRIAERLVTSKQSSAHLTTFNEIDMSTVSALRKEYRDAFEKKHGVRLGFMSFFVKASVAALIDFPVANAMIDGEDIIYNNRYNVGVAVSTDRGLIVPVVKDADRKSFAEIEAEIAAFAASARDKTISVDDLLDGTFSITNGGVFGSLLSTPIPTPPQSAILGMHTIQKRPVAVDDEVVIHPMMYVALTYDHRIMDGKDAVSFLVRIKRLVEDPRQLLLDL